MASRGVEDRPGVDGGVPADEGVVACLAADFRPIAVSFYRVRPLDDSSAAAMNLIAGQDRVLLGGLAVALIARFSRPIRALLELAH